MLHWTVINSSRRDRQGRRGSGVALHVRECFDCVELDDGGNRVDSLWVRISRKVNKADSMVGLCFRPPNQDEETVGWNYSCRPDQRKQTEAVLL